MITLCWGWRLKIFLSCKFFSGHLISSSTNNVDGKFICTSYRNRQKSKPLAMGYFILFLHTVFIYMYCVFLQCLKGTKFCHLIKIVWSKGHSKLFYTVFKGVLSHQYYTDTQFWLVSTICTTYFETTPVVKCSTYLPLVLYIMSLSPGLVKRKTNIGICCFSTKHTALRSKNNDRLAQNWDNIF